MIVTILIDINGSNNNIFINNKREGRITSYLGDDFYLIFFLSVFGFFGYFLCFLFFLVLYYFLFGFLYIFKCFWSQTSQRGVLVNGSAGHDVEKE